MRFKILAAALGLALAGPAMAATHVVTYSAASCVGGCTDGSPIDELFGSVADVVVANYRLDSGYSIVGGLNYWSDSYSGSSAAYADDAANLTRGAVAFFVNRPGTITLVSADFGGWPNYAVDIGWELFSPAGTMAVGSVTTNPSALTTVTFNASAGLNQPIALIFGPDAYNGGVQNLVFSFDAVPEPGTWAMLIAGFGLTGGALRRRRAIAAA